MTYDVDDGPPRSVEVQREFEDLVEQLRESINDRHVALVLVLAGVGWFVVNGDPGAASSSTSSWLAEWTLHDVVVTAGMILGLIVFLAVVVSLHELCHWAALNHLGYQAEWTVDAIYVRGIPVVPTGGKCWTHFDWMARMSYKEDVLVSLAPLVLSSVVLVGACVYHVVVSPFHSPGWFVLGIIIITGPSPPDWWSLFRTPRERWELLEDYERSLDRHRAAEGI